LVDCYQIDLREGRRAFVDSRRVGEERRYLDMCMKAIQIQSQRKQKTCKDELNVLFIFAKVDTSLRYIATTM